MFVEDIDLKEEKDTLEDESKNNVDEETTEDQDVEDANDTKDDEDIDDGDDDKSKDDEKEEDDEDVEDPHEKKLKDLKKQNKQKTAANTEKNKTIKQLKKKLNEEGLDADQIKAVVDDALGDKLQTMEETQERLDNALNIANESNIDTLMNKITDKPGEKKIYRHFFDTKVNKDLPLNERIAQAVILGKDAMSDEAFQKDVAKAEEVSKRNSGKQGGAAGDIPEDVKLMGENLFPDAKSRKKFYDDYRESNS